MRPQNSKQANEQGDSNSHDALFCPTRRYFNLVSSFAASVPACPLHLTRDFVHGDITTAVPASAVSAPAPPLPAASVRDDVLHGRLRSHDARGRPLATYEAARPPLSFPTVVSSADDAPHGGCPARSHPRKRRAFSAVL